MRQTWHNLPFNWKRSSRRLQLVEEHENVHQVELRLRSLSNTLAKDDWEQDANVVDQHHRLNALLQGRQAETDERRYQNNRAMEATVNARAAYIDRLRYTIKSYSKNIRQLGELAGIEVHRIRLSWKTMTFNWRRQDCMYALNLMAKAPSG